MTKTTTIQDQEDLQNKVFRTEDGFVIRVFSSMYIDWGLEIKKSGGEDVFYSPSALSNESYGFHWEDDDGEPLDEGISWTDQEWRETLESEADDFIEAYTS